MALDTKVAVGLAESRLISLPLVESLLAQLRLGSADARALDAAARTIEEHQREDGSWNGSLLRTAESLLLLGELRDFGRTNAVDRALDWVHARRNQPGAFGGQCDASLHELGLCNHFVAGFFSPAPFDVDLRALRLQSGSSLGSDLDARIATSALACAALLEWGERGSGLRLHVDGLCRLAEQAVAARFTLSTAAFACVVRCLVVSPFETDPYATAALDYLARSQRADGSWRGADLFLVLDVLADASERGKATPSVARAFRHSAALLRWGRETGAHELLTGWRALRQLNAGATRSAEISVTV